MCWAIAQSSEDDKSTDSVYNRLDVTQHMSLCRHYVRELRRSVLVETPELEKGSKRSSMILDQFTDPNLAGPSNGKEDYRSRDQHLSAFLRQEADNTNHSPQSSVGSNQSENRGSGDRAPNGERLPRASFMSTGLENHTTDSNSPAHTVARADLRASAEKILYTYLLPGSEREIILPQGILTDIVGSIEEDGRDDPEVFDAAKDYTFQAMERDAFPGFLRSKALGNLVPPSIKVRMALGLLAMFGGFWAGFALIFLNKPKHIRCWVSPIVKFSHEPCTNITFQAYTSVYDWCLLPCFTTVLHRPSPGTPRLQRVHLHELESYSRAVCPQSLEQTSFHGSGLHHSHRCSSDSTFHLRTREGAMILVSSL